MRTCSYCGHQNTDDREYCEGCAEPLVVETIRPDPPPAIKAEHSKPVEAGTRTSNLLSAGFFEDAEPLDLSSIDMGFSFDEGFSRPDWTRIRQGIKNDFSEELWGQVWREVGIKWLNQLCDDLGGNYNWYESWNFLLLSVRPEEDSKAILNFAETTMDSIQTSLDFVNSEKPLYGKRVILLFDEEDDYYSYISYFFTEGRHSRTGGVFIKKDYGHVALPFFDMPRARNVIAHELTHNYLMGLPLPLWLNEGLCCLAQRALGITIYLPSGPVLDGEMSDEHHDYWNERNIQEFWAGISFRRPGQGIQLSYNLAEIFVELASEIWGDFLHFVKNADYRDAGQDGALKYLGRSLGDVAGTFLGPGDWRPDRKAIAQLWEVEKKKESGEET